MKTKLKLLIGIALVLAMVTSAQSTTPTFGQGLKDMATAVTSGTNWTLLSGYGHSTAGNNNLAFAALGYNFTDSVGAVLGYDYIWNNNGGEFNALKGGVSLQTQIKPFAFVGSTFLTNIVCQPFVADLLATPRSGNAIGNIITTGVNFDVYAVKNFELTVGGQYEKRMGQGDFDGNYILFHVGLSRRF
jgi:hypothetical protein